MEEINSVSHVWFSSIGSVKHRSSYSRKSLVIYRKNDKPPVVYNISLLALYRIKKYNSKVEINDIETLKAGISFKKSASDNFEKLKAKDKEVPIANKIQVGSLII